MKVKSEICDAEGLGHKLEGKEGEMKDMKKQLKQKVQHFHKTTISLFCKLCTFHDLLFF